VIAAKQKGVLLGVDFGAVRVGLAVSDPDRIIASPLETVTRRSDEQDAAHYRRVATECRAVGFIVGLPLHADGRESAKSLEARAFGAWLSGVTGLPVVFWDERFTTSLAEDALLVACRAAGWTDWELGNGLPRRRMGHRAAHANLP
jgi:putative Holliday junction resolvase